MTPRIESAQIDRVLDAYKSDLWLERRHKIGEIVRDLENLLRSTTVVQSDGPLARSTRSMIEFLDFLERQCAGDSFADDTKQWSQLMNLMGISKKLNHQSVKLKDIIANRSVIEARSGDIRRFNEQARLIQTTEKLIKTFESDMAQVHLLLRASWKPDRGSVQDELTSISSGQRKLESTLKPTIQSLQVCLQNRSISRSVPSTRFETWSERLNTFSRITERLCSFIKDYLALKRELAHLHPLVGNLESSDKPDGANQRNDQLGNSIESCKRDFELVLRFESRLEEELRKNWIQVNRRQSATSRELGKNNSKNQEIPIKLIKLLKPTKYEDYSSELYDTELKGALKRAAGCRKLLDQTMSSLRLEFGRFYFVNDLELLTIISLDWRLAAHSERPENRQLISKLFNNSIQEFILSEEIISGKRHVGIVGLKTPIGEKILLADGGQEAIRLRKRVNLYSLEIVRIFNELQRKLQRCLAGQLEASLARNGPDFPDTEEYFDWHLPIQLLDLIERIKFTQRVENCLKRGGGKLSQLLTFYENRLKILSEPKSGTSISELMRSAATSLTIQLISRLCELLKHSVSSVNDWNWIKTVRYYWLGTLAESTEQRKASQQTDSKWLDPAQQTVEVRLTHTRFPYKFDLLTIETRITEVKRLIHTETSERCFLVASQAIGKLKLGANPYGPAGSGKTETIKALGQLLGCQVIVHNCDQTNTTEALERLIWGLAHTGLWGCFDEFNRLSSGTLSSVSGQLELVQTSLRSSNGNRTITVELKNGQMKSIDPNSAFFITMNPSDAPMQSLSRGYRGRRRLPANLRSLFLPVAMVRVQLDNIIREMLLTFTSGMSQNDRQLSMNANSAGQLGTHLAGWITWMRSNLQIDRCEWDLRLVMTILARLFQPGSEAISLIKSDASQAMIKCIVNEVWPRLSGQQEINLLAQSLRETFGSETFGAQLDELSGDCLQQLEEQLEIRPGVILLGECSSTGGSLWRSLAAKKNQLGPVVAWFQLNPKSCCKRDLLGHFQEISSSQDTAKWHDGLLTKLVRDSLDLLQTSSMQQVWLVLSGPIDPDWIESLNSVLDDNRVLTLSSGERLNFVLARHDDNQAGGKCIKLIFEAKNISNASPATISRLGLIDLRQISSKIAMQNIDKTPELQRANLTVVQLASEFELSLHDYVQLTRKCLMDVEDLRQDQANLYEFNCFEGTNSKHLIELLELMSANSSDELGQQCLIIHNLHLIVGEDNWSTRTFVELLLHVVRTMSYHDHEHKLKFISPRLQIIVTANEGSRRLDDFERLLEVAKERRTFNETDLIALKLRPHPNLTTHLDALVSWCGVGPEMSSPDGCPSAIKIVETKHQNATLDLVRQLEAEVMREKQTSSASDELEICLFSNSLESSRTIETLERLIEQEDAGLQAARRRLLIIDSLQMHLLEPNLKARLCFLLNLLTFRGFRFESLGLRCLFIVNVTHFEQDKKDPDYLYWLQLAVITSNEEQAKRHHLIQIRFELNKPSELDTNNQIRDFLSSKDANASYDVSSLASVIADFFREAGRDFNFEQRRYFLETSAKIGARLRKRAEAQSSLLSNGLKRLTEFDQAVERRRELRKAEEVELNARKQHIVILLERINKEIGSGREHSEQLIQLRQKQEVKTKELAAQRRELESKLANVLPKLEASKREIDDCLKPEALNEIKSLRAPPKALKDILEVLFLLLVPTNGGGLLDWSEMKSYLTKFSLRDELTTKFDFEKRLADERLVARLEHEISSRQQSFQLDQAARVSSAIVPVVKWLLATKEYGQTLVRVKPLTQRMRALEQEADELCRASGQLEIAQKQLDQKIAADQKELDELNSNYDKAKEKLFANKLQLDRAQKVRLSLAKPVERWRAELEQYENLISGHGDSLHWLSLISATLTLDTRNSTEFKEQIENWLAIVKEHRFNLKALRSLDATQNGDPLRNFLANCSGLLLQSIADQQFDDPTVWGPIDLSLGLKSFGTKQLDHLIKLLIIKLSIHFNPGQLLYIPIESNRSIESLRQYLSYKQILCPEAQDLVLIRPASSSGWLTASKELLNSSRNTILLVEFPQFQSKSEQILDVIDSSLSQRRISKDLARVILFGCKTNNFRPELRQLLRELDLDLSDTHEVINLEMSIENLILELREPKLASEILELESELVCQRGHAKRLELNLISKLMLMGQNRGDAGSNSDSGLGSQNELVRLLLELDQMNESLAIGIEQISSKLSVLQTKRDKFRSITKQMAQFYMDNLAQLKTSFYHLAPRQFVSLFIGDWPADDGPIQFENIIEHVMCSMRANDRQTFLNLLSDSSKQRSPTSLPDRVSLSQAAKRAANLEHALMKLTRVPNKATMMASQSCEPHTSLQTSSSSFNFRLAIVLHDARKSSPQMELDEFFARLQGRTPDTNRSYEFQYSKLYASSAMDGDSHLREQLERITANRSSASQLIGVKEIAGGGSGSDREIRPRRCLVKCICIANAHLAASWINTRLLDVVGTNLTGSTRSSDDSQLGNGGRPSNCEQVLIVVLVAECDLLDQEGREFSSDFDSNLLDEAHLKFWYDELGLELIDRWHLYQLNLASGTAHNEELRKQLVLFHVVCQELTLDNISDSSEPKSAWEVGQNYSFDYEQLSLAMKLLDMLADSKGTIDRTAFCHYIETIVYGARMETIKDERLFGRLVDQLLRCAELARGNWVRFRRLIELPDVSERCKEQVKFLEALIT